MNYVYSPSPWMEAANAMSMGGGGLGDVMTRLAQLRYQQAAQQQQMGLNQAYLGLAGQEQGLREREFAAKQPGMQLQDEQLRMALDQMRKQKEQLGQVEMLKQATAMQGNPLDNPVTGPQLLDLLYSKGSIASLEPQGNIQQPASATLQGILASIGAQQPAIAARMNEPVVMQPGQTARDPFNLGRILAQQPQTMSPYEQAHLQLLGPHYKALEDVARQNVGVRQQAVDVQQQRADTYDEATQMRNYLETLLGSGTNAAPAQSVVPPPAGRVVGQTYNLPKGRFTWTAGGWIPAQ